MDTRLHKVQWGPGQERKRTSDKNWKLPASWNSRAFVQCDSCGWRGEKKSRHACPVCGGGTCTPTRRRVFCASLADVFDNDVPTLWRQQLMTLVADTPNLDWLFLTKRIGNARKMLAGDSMHDGRLLTASDEYKPPANLWIGATIVNQEEADRDIPKLLATPAAVRFLSMEPLLGPVDLAQWLCDFGLGRGSGGWGNLHWIIAGGESGRGARPMHPHWARSLRDQCEAAGVPFLFKQWGEWLPVTREASSDGSVYLEPVDGCGEGPATERKFPTVEAHGHLFARTGKKAAGRLLDGETHNGFPRGAA